MKYFIVCTVLVVAAFAEPPVDNRYLPPQARTSPSQVYGTPGFNNQRQTGALIGDRPFSSYSAPSRQSISNQYIPPQSQQYQAPANQYQAPSAQYGVPNQAQAFSQSRTTTQFSAPSQEYGTPAFGRGGSQEFLGSNDQSQSRQYLPPGARGYDDGSNGEPANYNFEYMVLDQYSGNDFGHRESRQGDRAEGTYYVLLPDGRKQTVQYEADQDGYKPRITYEDTGAGAGYDRNSQGYSNQYESGPY